MKIYRVKATIWDYWYDCDRDGYQHEEKFFSTQAKAEAWCEENKNFCYAYKGNEADPAKPWQKPKFEIEEIEVE